MTGSVVCCCLPYVAFAFFCVWVERVWFAQRIAFILNSTALTKYQQINKPPRLLFWLVCRKVFAFVGRLQDAAYSFRVHVRRGRAVE